MKARLMTVIGLIFAMSMAFVSAQVPTVSPVPSGGGSGSGSPTAIVALPMIKSQDALRNYQFSIAHFGSRNVQAPSMDWSWQGNVSYTEVSGAFGEEILAKLFDTELVYRLTNPDDMISGSVYLYDGPFGKAVLPNLLFQGSASYLAADLIGGKPQYNIWIQDVPLPLSNVSSAEVLALDSDGVTARRIPIVVKNGQPIFQPWLAGSPNGILVSRDENGMTTTYDLSNPVGKVPTFSIETASYKVDGHYVYQKGGLSVIKITELWSLPSVFLEVGANEIITFDVMGLVQMDGKTTFERPTEWIYEQVDGPWAGAGPILQDQPTQTSLPAAGKYRIRFGWKNFGKPNRIYTGPMDGKGNQPAEVVVAAP